MLRVEWTEPVDFNGVFQTYTVLVSVKEGSNAKLHNTTQWRSQDFAEGGAKEVNARVSARKIV